MNLFFLTMLLYIDWSKEANYVWGNNRKYENGDEDALCKLYSVYAQSALRSAYLITNNLHSAQDAVEDTFVQCYNNINKLKNNGAFKVWFYKILTRNACKYAKRIIKHSSWKMKI